MTPEEAAQRLERLANDLRTAANAGLAEILAEAKAAAIRWSSGPLKTAELRRMGHPYARRAPMASVDPGRINIQERRAVVEGWVYAPVHRGAGGGLKASVYNTAPEAGFLSTGTPLMERRPLPERVIAEIEPRVEEIMARAVERVLGR